jgi:hypothetical protein
MGDHAAAPHPYVEALARAWKVLYKGVILDAAVTIGLGLLLLLPDGDVLAPGFWVAVGTLVVRSLGVSLAKFLAQLKLGKAAAAEAAEAHAATE